ncbi:two-component sensor histidine kinase [Chryseotalea sanaruensis]|uniref:histidine kinase n=1 Tax=Chryseotalea sanaruensis TaxID=2482724 RepID=A0A401UDI2_9BACT|nr:ATP-binding protein [Chryseotalea sanaruensis]GCC52965.1 two-component sensor histidine kinase [Chryseotalea sanaruensis]
MKNRVILLVSLLSLAAGIYLLYSYRQPIESVSLTEVINKNVEQQLAIVEKEAVAFRNTDSTCNFYPKHRFPFFIYKNKTLICWTDNAVVPPVSLLSDKQSVQLVKIARGNFLLYQEPIGEGRQLMSLIVLTRDFPIQNDFLTNVWNTEILPSAKVNILEPFSNLGIPVSYKGNILFRLSFLQSDVAVNVNGNLWAVSLIFFAIIGFSIGLFSWLYRTQSLGRASILSATALIFTRIVLLQLNFPRAFSSSEIFSPQRFASSTLNPSLGDLLLNVLTILFVAIIIFRYWQKEGAGFKYKELSPLRLLLLVVASFLLFSIWHYPVQTLQTIMHNSSIEFAITSSLDTSLIRILSLVAILLTWTTAFLLNHIAINFLTGASGKHAHRILMMGTFLFGFVNYWEEQPYMATIIITWSVILIIQYVKFSRSLERIQYKTFGYFFLVLFGLVINVAVRLYYLDKEQHIENQVRFAESYLVDRDSFGEFLLNDLTPKIKQDVFIQTRLVSPFLSKLPIQQKIRQVYFSSYFNKYDINIQLFNSAGDNLTGYSSASFSDIIKSLDLNASRTEYEGLYRLSNKGKDVAQQYVLVIKIDRGVFVSGYILIELSLKRILPQNAYPELLVDNRFRESLKPNDLTYASFAMNRVQASAGDFNYERDFDKKMLGEPELYTTGVVSNGYQHYAVEGTDNVVIVVSSKLMTYKGFLANVSFYLILGLFLILLLVLWLGISNLIKRKQVFYAARIQLFITLSFFVPLLVVSIITLRMLNESSQSQLNNTYLNRAGFIAEQLEDFTNRKDSLSGSITNQEYVTELARLANAELTLYSSDGALQVTSQNSVFDNQLMAPIAHPLAMQKVRNGEKIFVLEDKIGNLSYFIAYASLGAGQSLLAIPYYQSAASIESVQIEALSEILVIFGIVFLLLLLFSFLISRWLTFPIEFITNTLQRTSLEHSNEPINWKSNDEIGLMVNSYNDMLRNLSESKLELERMQREQAWREIAQQVAHEIKNPLTPMKLTLQRMSRSLLQQDLNSEKISGSVNSLLEQVELLNTIASSFSSFAKMPTAVVGEVNIQKLIAQSMELYKHEIEIIHKNKDEQMLAKADPVILLSVFSNLILNAIQAKAEDREIKLTVETGIENAFYKIQFIDNGKGIEDEKLDKIFIPHFTTKETGSGLGLAIARQAVEQMGGSISFTSVIGQGSTFVILLPIA